MSASTKIDPLVPQRVENAIKERLNQLARENCREFMDSFVACSRERTISVVWACKDQTEKWKDCNRKYTNETNISLYKREYVALQEERGVEKRKASPSS